MLEKPMSGAITRASLEKQFQAFRKCAKGIISNGLEEPDRIMFKPGDTKTPRMKKLGISIRIKTINANVNLTNEGQIEFVKGILTMQQDYSQTNLEEVLSGEKLIKLSKLNTNGKPKWSASIKPFNKPIFKNVSNDEVNVENLEGNY